ncbi:MAG: hypothetical protein QOE70_3505 [Chthoniobacter sp.]|jgi:hypothetical protein|nr:hypothetical protein [Chthoniobacter sp.]
MPLEPAAARNLAAILRSDLSALDRLSGFVDRFASGIETASPNDDRMWAAAMVLHHLYIALEHSFERIARTCDGFVAEQPRWHRDLASRMFLDLPGGRPAVLSPELRTTLDELLAFRHFVRHAYDVALEPKQIGVVIALWQEHRTQLRNQFEAFILFLEGSEQPSGHP